jgi:hypothetical protein
MIKVDEVDNRDSRTTWLWIGNDYVEVDPVDLIENMLENCSEWYKEEGGLDQEDLDRVLFILKSA